MAEVAAGAAGSLRGDLRPAGAAAMEARGLATTGDEALTRLAARIGGGDGMDMRGAPDPPRSDPPRSDPPRSDPPRTDPPVEASGPSDSSSAEDAAHTGDEAPPTGEKPFSEQTAVELGPNIGSARVHPHPDAE
jgi:hypothetical protein